MSLQSILKYFLLLILTSCYSNQFIYNQDYEDLYNSEPIKIHPKLKVFHHSNISSTLYLRFNRTDFLYAKSLYEDVMTLKIKVHYKLFRVENQAQLNDSGTRYFSYPKEIIETPEVTDSLLIMASRGNEYIMDIEITDLHRNTFYKNVLFVDKRNIKNEQFMLIRDSSLFVYFDNYLNAEIPMYIQSSDSTLKEILVDYHRLVFPPAQLPYTELGFKDRRLKADSAFVLKKESNYFKLKDKHRTGLLSMNMDSSLIGFLGLGIYNSYYPNIISPKDMVEALKYICNDDEYKKMLHVENKKLALDEFWLQIAGDKERARVLIKTYYARVRNANTYFTSYLEGWKSDRGMIYIVFGAPTHVAKSAFSEIWTYGESNNFNSITFTFNKINNKLTNNDFELHRNPLLKDDWNRGKELWREGRIYNTN